MLCKMCASLNVLDIMSDEGESVGTEHQPTFMALTTSAFNGCSLCSLFRATIFDTYKRVMLWSEEDVQRYQDQRDGKATTTFVIRATAVDLDKKYAPFEDGYSGFFYLRRTPKDPNGGKQDANDMLTKTRYYPG